jgi:hypothetical protein
LLNLFGQLKNNTKFYLKVLNGLKSVVYFFSLRIYIKVSLNFVFKIQNYQMKNFTLFCIALLLHFESISQTSQLSIGSPGVTQNFNDLKFDSADGSTVYVGYINDAATGNGNDCFITKMNSDHQILWQKIIPNPGDDVLNRVSICANGDYIVAGKIFQSGVLRGLVCRIDSSNGNIIWSTSSSLILTTAGEEFFDLIETVNQNIAVVGYTNYTPPNTRGIIVLLNSSGQ